LAGAAGGAAGAAGATEEAHPLALASCFPNHGIRASLASSPGAGDVFAPPPEERCAMAASVRASAGGSQVPEVTSSPDGLRGLGFRAPSRRPPAAASSPPPRSALSSAHS
jgi:hypothetical protein